MKWNGMGCLKLKLLVGAIFIIVATEIPCKDRTEFSLCSRELKSTL